MYKLVLTARYLVKRRITHFAILAVALCVFIVVVVMTVMTGLVGDLKQKNHDFVGDCVVGTKSLVGFPYYEDFLQILDRTDRVQGASPVVRNYALLRPEGDDQFQAEIMGIDPVRHSRTTSFGQSLHYRRAEPAKAFDPTYDPNLPGCVLGVYLAFARDTLGRYTVANQPPRKAITLMCVPLNAKGAPAQAGTSGVASQRFYYSDYSQTGIARIDDSTVYVPLGSTQSLCMAGTLKRVNAIYIKFTAGTAIGPACREISDLWDHFKQTKAQDQDASLLDSVTVETWKEYRRAFIAPMEKEEAIMAVMFGFVGITTVFIVFVVFYMIVSHKTKDIGILRGVGASRWDVLGLFCSFGAAIGLIGDVAGILVGWLFLAKINHIEHLLFKWFKFQLWNRSLYAIGDIPNQMRFDLVVVVACCALAACLIGSLLPAYYAASLRPVETLHDHRL